MKSARIIVLTVALAAGGVSALLAGRSGKSGPPEKTAHNVSSSEILVAKKDLSTGTKILPQDLQWQAWPATVKSKNFIHKDKRPGAITKLSGLTVRTPFVAGEPIQEAKLVNAKGAGYMAAILPSGMRAVATKISAETGAGGFILPNDHVDVILTVKQRGKRGQSETILSNIRVLAIDQAVEEKHGQKVVVGKTATLELPPRGVETLELAQERGSISLALRSITDARKNSPEKEETGRRINIIRSGANEGA
ncbi:MAG: Flp pilus assembly protein CpaB [Pseudolabrys sp.]|jgi:pilus assembly protein CpaB